jgi:hypothetical protein
VDDQSTGLAVLRDLLCCESDIEIVGTPSGLAVTFTYNGSATAPANAGSYAVVGTINDPNYQGSAAGTLVIAQASGSIVLGNLSQTYNGSAKAATATTIPTGLAVSFTYNGSATAPANAGSYAVVGRSMTPIIRVAQPVRW